jgi:two-component system, LytTR family, sensor kinase
LNTAVSLVRVNRTETAVRVLTDLGDILRRLLQNAPDQEIALHDELAFLSAYVAIEKIRFADRLTVRMHVPDDVMNALVPNLLLQPLVENAIRYGVGNSNAAGHVDVSARRHDGKLILQVRDDGPGLPDQPHVSGAGGVGLANTQERLQQMYGPLHEFLLGNRATGGCEVTITIPLQLATNEPANANGDRMPFASANA